MCDEQASGPSSLRMDIAFNPLKWTEHEFGQLLIGGGGATPEGLLNFLRGPFQSTTLDELKARYDQLAVYDNRLMAVPRHPRLLNGVLRPVHNAKSAFILGHYVSCISLAGVVAEMLAIFRFEIAGVTTASGPLDDLKQRLLWGRTFEQLGQQNRADALHALSLIDEPTWSLFKNLLGVRRKYMHLLEDDRTGEQQDAEKAYSISLSLCSAVIGGQTQGGSRGLRFQPDVMRWAATNNLITPVTDA